MDPQTEDDWLAVANERHGDARAVCSARPQSIGGAYLSGYAVESAFKAYLRYNGKSFPKGKEGHDLLNLMSRAGLQIRSLATEQDQAWLIEHWTVDWRYEKTTEGLSISAGNCVSAAGKLRAYIEKLISRQKARRRR